MNTPPDAFVEALLSIRQLALPDTLEIAEVPAPPHLAPFSAALKLVTKFEIAEHPAAHSTFVILHDPTQVDVWGGPFRLVGHVRTQIDHEMGSDPLLVEVTWNDFLTCLDEVGAHYLAPMGTVTRELSEAFGGLELRSSALNLEFRCSWTPMSDVGQHLLAWASFVLLSAGIDEHPMGLEVHGA